MSVMRCVCVLFKILCLNYVGVSAVGCPYNVSGRVILHLYMFVVCLLVCTFVGVPVTV